MLQDTHTHTHTHTHGVRHNRNTYTRHCRKLKGFLSHSVLSLPELLIHLQILWKCNPWCIWQPLSSQRRSHRYHDAMRNRTQHTTKQHNVTQTTPACGTTRRITNTTRPRTRRRKTGLLWSPDDDTLILSVDHHVSVHVISQRVDVRRILILGLKRQI